MDEAVVSFNACLGVGRDKTVAIESCNNVAILVTTTVFPFESFWWFGARCFIHHVEIS